VGISQAVDFPWRFLSRHSPHVSVGHGKVKVPQGLKHATAQEQSQGGDDRDGDVDGEADLPLAEGAEDDADERSRPERPIAASRRAGMRPGTRNRAQIRPMRTEMICMAGPIIASQPPTQLEILPEIASRALQSPSRALLSRRS
jgi:hypothetical protein